jgi:MinD-like ATPase involved in chromosome partitioning or flagellar assembly
MRAAQDQAVPKGRVEPERRVPRPEEPVPFREPAPVAETAPEQAVPEQAVPEQAAIALPASEEELVPFREPASAAERASAPDVVPETAVPKERAAPTPKPVPPPRSPEPGMPPRLAAPTTAPGHHTRDVPTRPHPPLTPAIPAVPTVPAATAGTVEAPGAVPPLPTGRRPRGCAARAWRTLSRAMRAGASGTDGIYEERIRTRIDGARRIVVLGCTGGAGQTVTALMLGHTFAAHRDDRIIAVDVNPGPTGLAGRTRSETRETLTSLLTHAERLTGYPAMRRHTSATRSGLEIVAAGKNPVQALDDRDYALATRTLDRFYAVSLLDAAAAVVARVLPYTDQIVLVAPASEDAPRAVGMTFEWLDGHGYDELRARAVTVINGVSRSTLADVEQAEMVAKGRCRALVRIPWDAHLDPRRPPCNELRALRAPTRKAYLALAGVVAGGFAQVPERHRQREVTR